MMSLFDVSQNFSPDPSQWNVAHPGRVLPRTAQSYLSARFGNVFAATDLSRLRSPSRLGVIQRPYESGDPLKTLSLPHFVRTQQLETRIEFAPGRARVGVVFHAYDNMTYASESAKVNKGQLALGFAAFVETLHDAALHAFEMLIIRDTNLDSALRANAHRIRTWEHRYLITDGLYANTARELLALPLGDTLTSCGIRPACVAIVRDRYEHPQLTPLRNISDELLPYSNLGVPSTKVLSGTEYAQNLATQFEFVRQSLAAAGNRCFLLDSDSTLESLAHEVRLKESMGVQK